MLLVATVEPFTARWALQWSVLMTETQQQPPLNCETAPEYVAMRMAEIILIYIEDGSWNHITREKYLDTYAECLETVRGNRAPGAAAPLKAMAMPSSLSAAR